MESNNNIICFVCDKMFPINQLQNHVNKCKVVYEQQNKLHLLMPEEYKILFDAYKEGVLPDYETLENFNRMLEEKSVKYGQSIATAAEYREQNRGFQETLKKSKEPIKQKRLPGQKPIGLICPLCGREFGTMSLKFHLKSCKQKFDLAQKSVPANKRRNADQIIANYEKNQMMGMGAGNNYDALNQQAFDQYNKDALVECEFCGRTFLPDRLPVHQRVCSKHPEMFKKKK